MTCAVPGCHQLSTTAGVCAVHWLEADEAAHGAARIDAELLAIRAEESEADERRARELEAARARRAMAPADNQGERILDRIVDKFWNEAGSGRNNALAGAAWAAGRLVAGGELGREETVRRLVTEGVAAGLPLREAMDVVRGQVDRAKARPRVLEPEPIGRRWARA